MINEAYRHRPIWHPSITRLVNLSALPLLGFIAGRSTELRGGIVNTNADKSHLFGKVIDQRIIR